MRKVWLCRWLASLCAMTLFATFTAISASGCGDFGATTSGFDGPDVGLDGGPTLKRTQAQFNVFNNSPNLYPFRLCFKSGATVLKVPPYPNDVEHPMPNSSYPGIDQGGVQALPLIDLAELIGDASVPTTIEVIAVRALRIAGSATAEARCPELVCQGGTCLESGPDFLSLGFADLVLGSPSILTINGCPASGLGASITDTSLCGPGFSASKGNLKATIQAISTGSSPGTNVNLLDTTNAKIAVTWYSGGKEVTLGGGFVPVSLPSALSAYATEGVYVASSDAGISDGGSLDSGSDAPLDAPDAANDAAIDGQPDALAHDAEIPEAGPRPSGTFFSLATVQSLSDPTSLPNTFFANGQFVIAVLGKESAGLALNADGTRNLSPGALRVVALRITAQSVH